jgi:hypothetical protein
LNYLFAHLPPIFGQFHLPEWQGNDIHQIEYNVCASKRRGRWCCISGGDSAVAAGKTPRRAQFEPGSINSILTDWWAEEIPEKSAWKQNVAELDTGETGKICHNSILLSCGQCGSRRNKQRRIGARSCNE